jgi:hypothetical protein
LSLKAFHIFFIAVSFVVALVFGAWGVNEFIQGAGVLVLLMGLASFLIGGVLVIYGKRVWHKLNDLNSL